MQTLYLAEGCTEDDIAGALAMMRDGGTLVLPKDSVISITNGISLTTADRDITLDLNGSVLQQTGNNSVIYAGGSMGVARAVEYDFSGENTKITYEGGVPSDLAVGGWIKLAADDLLPNDNRNTELPTRMGQAMQVLSIDDGVVTLAGSPLYPELYSENVRAASIISGQLTILNGTVKGNQDEETWTSELVQVRDAVDTYIEGVTVRDGNSMGINLVNNVNAKVVDSAAINLKDDVTQGYFGYGVHSASSLNTTVIGLYAERVRHATDDNGVGIEADYPYLAKYGADIGMTVKSSISYYASAFSYSFHSEARGGVLDDVMSFESHGFVGLRGVAQTVVNSASVGDERGFQFFEYGYGDAKDMLVDNVVIRESGLYVYVVSGNPTNNTISNSYLEYDYRPGNPGTTTLINTTVIRSNGVDDDLFVGTNSTDRLLGGRGNDLIEGRDGNDYIWGGGGSDTLTGGAGRDRFAFHDAEGMDVISDFQVASGGDYIDISIIAARYGWKGDVLNSDHVTLIDLEGGMLFQITLPGADMPVALAYLLGVSSANFSADNLLLSISGGAGVYSTPPPTDAIQPGETNYVKGVTITGTAAADLIDKTHSPGLLPTAGKDYINTGNGEDYVDGLGGADTILLGAGNDTVIYYPGFASSFNGGSGRDTLVLSSSDVIDLSSTSDQSEGLPTFAGFDNVDGSKSTVPLTIIGDDNNNSLSGGSDDDRFMGKGGHDQIDGGAGNDTVIYDGNREDYSFIKISDTTWRVQDLRGVPYRDYVSNVERVSFQDQLAFINTLNRAPTDVVLDGSTVIENAPSGTVIGKVIGIDLDVSEDNTVELLSDGNGAFGISGIDLVTLKPLDHETETTLDIVIRLTDSAGHPIEKTFTIHISDLDEAPQSVSTSVGVDAGGRVMHNSEQGLLALLSEPEGGPVAISSARASGGDWTELSTNGEAAVQGKYGLLLISQSGAYSYMQDPSTGTSVAGHLHDEFEYVVADSHGNTSSSLVQFVIDRRPQIVSDSLTISVDQQSLLVGAADGLLANDVDADGDALSIVPSSLELLTGRFGYLQLAADGSYSYSLFQRPLGDAQTDTFSYQVSDGRNSYLASVDFQVAPQPRPLNVLSGTAGNDVLSVQADQFDVVDGLAGFDTLEVIGDDLAIQSGSDELTFSWSSSGSSLAAKAIEEYIVSGGNIEVEGNFSSLQYKRFELHTIANGGFIDASASNAPQGFSIIGSSASDHLVGSQGNDVLDGRQGSDYLAGGKGNDAYIVDADLGSVFEAVSEGVDRVLTSLDTYTLTANVEEMIYTGTKRVVATGNDLDNLLRGGSGNDRLDGKLGVDSLAGGKGDDTYVTDNIHDKVIEGYNQGSDRVLSSVSYVLSDNVEILQLTTSAKLTGTGNGLANKLTGNNSANVLDGRGGADGLTGGLGDDVFVFRFGETAGDAVTDFEGAAQKAGDVLRFVGFGADAHLTQVGTSDFYTIVSDPALGSISETFQIVGVHNLSFAAQHGDLLYV